MYILGRFIADRLAPGINHELRIGISIGIGFAILSYIVMLIGVVCIHTTLPFDLSLLYLFILLLPLILIPLWPFFTSEIFRAGPERFKFWKSEFKSPGDRFLLVLIGILATLDLINCGNAAVGWDAAVHHYAFPNALIHAGGLINAPEIPFSFYPSLVEMLFTFGLSTASVFGAGLMTWIYLFPLSAGLISIGRNLGNPRIGLWAIILFLGAPLTFELPFSGVIDLPFFTYCVLALALLLDGKKQLSWGKIILIGILIGCASATKHLGLLFLIAFIPILIWKMIGETDSKKRTGRVLIGVILVTLFALLVPLPWYIRSFVATGNPIHPFLGELFQQAGSQAGNFSVEAFARTDYPRTLIGFLGYLWHLTMNYWDQRPWYLAIHPAWLALLPPAIVWAVIPSERKKSPLEIGNIRIILVLAFLTMLLNFFLAPAYPRYLFPTWICLSLTSAWALVKIREYWPSIGKVLVPIILILPFVIVLGMAAKRSVEVIPQYFSETARRNAIVQVVPGYETFEWANENLNRSVTLILSIDPKIYYLDSPTIIAKPGIESDLIVPWDSDPSDIIANWRELGVTHFILDTTLLSVKHGFGIALFSSILDDRDSVWLDIETTRAAADEFGIGDILTDDEFFYMSDLAELPVTHDGTRGGRHLLTRERIALFQSWGRDWRMAETLLKFIQANPPILVEEFRSGPGGGLRIYSIHLPPSDDTSLPENTPLPDLPDITEWCLPYEDDPVDRL